MEVRGFLFYICPMKTKLYPYLVGAVVVSAIAIGIYYSEKQESKPFVQTEIEDKTNLIFNNTNLGFYDTIILTGLNILGVEGVGVTVEPVSNKAKQVFANQGGELAAHIREFYGSYYLYIEPASKSESIDVIAHELIHLVQYNSGQLSYANDTITWNNEKYHKYELPYFERPWEVDAEEKGVVLASKIKQKLY